MSGDIVQFPAAAVRRHAGSVQAVAGAVEQARSAVREVTMDTGAYGKLCQFLPAILEPACTLAVQALGESVDGLHETALGLRAVADGTETTDAANGRRITAAGPASTLPELPL